MRVTSHEEAEHDVAAAIDYYQEQSPKAAEKFVDALRAATQALCTIL